MRRLWIVGLCVLAAGCALPLAINAHLDQLEKGIAIAAKNAAASHAEIAEQLAEQKAAAYANAKAQALRVAATQPEQKMPLAEVEYILRNLEKMTEAIALLEAGARENERRDSDNYEGLRRLLANVKTLVSTSQNLSGEVQKYIEYLEKEKGKADENAAGTH